MSFPLGRPILAMIVIACATGLVAALWPQAKTSDLVVWTFAESHARTYRGDGKETRPSLVELYREKTGGRARIDLVVQRSLDIRLVSMFMSQSIGQQVPDLAEVEINSVGKFFRPPVEEVGFLPLNEYLEQSGWKDRIVASRLTPYTKQGKIFGIPHDLHPVTITYRKDLFDEAGVDLSAASTWPQFQELCLRYQQYWQSKGQGGRAAMELPMTTADYLVTMLLQRHVNVLDDQNRPHLTDDKVVQTIVFYANLVAGNRRIAIQSGQGTGAWTSEFVNGDFAACITPDWRTAYLRQYASSLAGHLRMVPLPRFDADDAPTSTWGGTMIGIPRNCKDPAASWELLRFLYLENESVEARLRYTDILSPVREHWSEPAYHRQDPLYGGQKVGELYISLADRIPARYVTPFTSTAIAQLSVVLNRAVEHLNQRGDDGLEEACRVWLKEQEADLLRRIQFGTFEP